MWQLPHAAVEGQGCRAMRGFKEKKGKKVIRMGFFSNSQHLKGMPSTSEYEAQYLEEGESANRLLMVLS